MSESDAAQLEFLTQPTSRASEEQKMALRRLLSERERVAAMLEHIRAWVHASRHGPRADEVDASRALHAAYVEWESLR